MSSTTLKSSDQEGDEPPLQIDEEELKRLNQEMIMSDLITPDKIYLDLALFKDFNIGALLSILREMRLTQPDVDRVALYKSIIMGLPEYQNRKFDDIAHHFPKFGVSTEDIHNRFRDPRWVKDILHNSPVTPFLETLRGQLAVNANHSTVSGKRDPVNLVINTYPLKLEEMDRHLVGLYFAQQFKVHVSVIYLDMKQVKLNDVVGYDEIYTYHFIDLFNSEEVREGYTALKFIRKRLFVPRLFGNKHTPGMNTEKEELITTSRCDILTMFKFVPVRLCSALSPE